MQNFNDDVLIVNSNAINGCDFNECFLQIVVLRVSLHCKGCEGKVRKHLSRMEGKFYQQYTNIINPYKIEPLFKHGVCNLKLS